MKQEEALKNGRARLRCFAEPVRFSNAGIRSITLSVALVVGSLDLSSVFLTPPASGQDLSPYIAPYVPTPQEVVDRMLELAEIKSGDVVYDLGSGDGRIVITAAARYRVRAVGFEISPDLVKTARENVQQAGVAELVEIREEDIQNVDLSAASVVTLYLYPGANLRLRPMILRQLKPGSRVISHQFAMGDWKPDLVEQITDKSGIARTLYLWRIKPR